MHVFRNLFQADVYFIWLDLSWPSAQMIPDVFYLRTVLWKVKPGRYSRCLCEHFSICIPGISRCFVTSAKAASEQESCLLFGHCFTYVAWGLGRIWRFLCWSQAPDKQHQRCSLTACWWWQLPVVPSHEALSHPFLLLEQGFLNNEQESKPRVFPSFQPHCNGL